jgi:hypothetical protein
MDTGEDYAARVIKKSPINHYLCYRICLNWMYNPIQVEREDFTAREGKNNHQSQQHNPFQH